MPSGTLPYYLIRNGHASAGRKAVKYKWYLRPSIFDFLRRNRAFFNISQVGPFIKQERAYRGQVSPCYYLNFDYTCGSESHYRKGFAMAQWEDQLKKIKQIVEIMKDHNLVEVQIKQGEDEISVKKGQPPQPHITTVPVIGHGLATVLPAGQAHAPEAAKQENLIEIKSPLVGTFYAQPSPDSEPFIEVSAHVEPQTVVCIVEAMKVMNEIKAETNGTIVEVVAVNGEAVEYGQVLFRVRPD